MDKTKLIIHERFNGKQTLEDVFPILMKKTASRPSPRTAWNTVSVMTASGM
jgi:hypothetical protein